MEIFKRDYGQLIGIDLAEDAISFLQLSANSNGIMKIIAYGRVCCNEQDDYNMQLRKLVLQYNLKGCYVATAIADSEIMQHTITVPAHYSSAEIFDLIEVEAENYLTMPYATAAIDFAITNKSTVAGNMKVQVIAATKQVIDLKLALLESAGLKLKVVDVESCAIIRAISNITNKPEIILIIVAQKKFKMYVLNDGIITRQHAQEFAANNLCQKIAQSLQSFNNTNDILLAGNYIFLKKIKKFIMHELNITTNIIDLLSTLDVASNISRENLIGEQANLLLCYGLALRSFKL